MFKNILVAVGAFFSGLAAKAETGAEAVGVDIVKGVESVAPEAEAYLSGLVTKYAPVALAQVQAAAADPNLQSSEKRSAVFTKLAETLQADGHDIEADGFNSFVNLLVEVGVNTAKLIAGTFLGAATPAAQPAAKEAPAAQEDGA